jgi:hypothetical protein
MLGPRYVVIESAMGVSKDNGISRLEPLTLEAQLNAEKVPVRFIPI